MVASYVLSNVASGNAAEQRREHVLRLAEWVGSGPVGYFDDPLALVRALALVDALDAWTSKGRRTDGIASEGERRIAAEGDLVACVVRLMPETGPGATSTPFIADCTAAAAAVARLSPPMPLIVVTDDANVVQLMFESGAWIAGVLPSDAIELDWREVLGRVAAYDRGRARTLATAGMAAVPLGRA